MLERFQSLRGAHVRCNLDSLYDSICAVAEFQSLQGAHVRCNVTTTEEGVFQGGVVSIAPWSACPLQPSVSTD